MAILRKGSAAKRKATIVAKMRELSLERMRGHRWQRRRR